MESDDLDTREDSTEVGPGLLLILAGFVLLWLAAAAADRAQIAAMNGEMPSVGAGWK